MASPSESEDLNTTTDTTDDNDTSQNETTDGSNLDKTDDTETDTTGDIQNTSSSVYDDANTSLDQVDHEELDVSKDSAEKLKEILEASDAEESNGEDQKEEVVDDDDDNEDDGIKEIDNNFGHDPSLDIDLDDSEVPNEPKDGGEIGADKTKDVIPEESSGTKREPSPPDETNTIPEEEPEKDEKAEDTKEKIIRDETIENSDEEEKKKEKPNETETKEIENSVESISNKKDNVEIIPKRSNSFEESVEKRDEDPNEGDDLSGDTTEASDMEKYMDEKTKERKQGTGVRPQLDVENDQRQATENVETDNQGAKSSLHPSVTIDPKLNQVSLSDDSDTDSLHSMEESDHFKDRKIEPLDALRTDASSTDASHSKSNNHHKTSYGSINMPGDPASQSCRKCYPTGFCNELHNMRPVIWPMFFIHFFQFLFGPVALMYIGHQGTNEFIGVALALSVINVTGISVAVGLGNACDTVFFQLHKSAHTDDSIIALQRGILFSLLTAMPCYALYLNAEPILLAIGIEPSICSITGDYLLAFTPGILAFFLYILLAKFIINSKKIYFMLWVLLISNLLNVMLHFVLVYEMDLGPRGSAISLTCSFIFMLILTLAYLFWAGLVRSRFNLGWKRESLQEWGSFFRVAFPSMVLTCAEWWTVEAGLFLAGILGLTEMGAQAVLIQLQIICYMLSLGLGATATIRISQSLRVGEADRAKTLSRVALVVTVLLSVILALLLYALHTVLPMVFVTESAIGNLASSVIPVICLFTFFNCFMVVNGGIFRACGRFFLGATIAVISFVVSVGVGVLLMFKQSQDLTGWWIALGAVCALEVILCIFINVCTNWDNQVKQAKIRYDMLMSTSKSFSSGKHGEKSALLAAKEKEFTASYDDYYSKDFDFHASYENPNYTYSGNQQYSSTKASESKYTLGPRGLSTSQLVLRRGSLLLLFLGMLIAGIVLRFWL